jgi:hypothetical protein
MTVNLVVHRASVDRSSVPAARHVSGSAQGPRWTSAGTYLARCPERNKLVVILDIMPSSDDKSKIIAANRPELVGQPAAVGHATKTKSTTSSNAITIAA